MLLCGLVAALAGPASGEPEPVLRVGTSGDYAPFSVVEPGAGGDDAYAGFDIEVARRLAHDLGMRLELSRFTWPELAPSVASNRFDIAMSGVTWRPFRAVTGHMSRAVAAGGPCVIGDPQALRIAVNRGGILERYARDRFSDREVVAVDDNRSLPGRLRRGAVGAIVTDSFELEGFLAAAGDVPHACEPARDRKVYWVAPAVAPELGPRVDAWIRGHEDTLAELRARHFGAAGRRTEIDHLVDLIDRRLALMPDVGAYKRARGIAIEDLAREARVLASSLDAAAAAGLAPESVRALFVVQIELAKAIQERTDPADRTELDLAHEIRPLLLSLGARIVDALRRVAPIAPAELDARAALLRARLEGQQWSRLRAALLAVRAVDTTSP